MPHSIDDLLHHIWDEIEYLDKNSVISKEEFLGNQTLQRAFIRSLEIIGEDVKKLPLSFKSNHQ